MATELSDCSDFMTKHGAGILASHINEYWAERGFNAEAERYDTNLGAFGVRSNMVNGWPTKRA
jgi:hypothetical protein